MVEDVSRSGAGLHQRTSWHVCSARGKRIEQSFLAQAPQYLEREIPAPTQVLRDEVCVHDLAGDSLAPGCTCPESSCKRVAAPGAITMTAVAENGFAGHGGVQHRIAERLGFPDRVVALLIFLFWVFLMG